MSDLANQSCVPSRPGTPALHGEALHALEKRLGHDWKVVEGPRLEKTFKFPNFVDALAFVNRVGEVAEQEGHHPDVELGWGRVKIILWTHSIGGLSESDFVLAAKAEKRL